MSIPSSKRTRYVQENFGLPVTKAKYDELLRKLEHLTSVSRPRAIEEMGRLAESGDFSENAGYQAAKGRLRGINRGIAELEEQLRNAVIIQKHGGSGQVHTGDTVILVTKDREVKYQIFGSLESDPGHGIISSSSPLGCALIGRRIGDVVQVKLDKRVIEYTIKKIE
jgi:transcription elongation GreA/GreB family factor